jgi:hypothetical protein
MRRVIRDKRHPECPCLGHEGTMAGWW